MLVVSAMAAAQSPLHTLYSQHSMDAESGVRSLFMGNPALVHCMVECDSAFYLRSLRHTDKLYIAADYGSGSQKGDYLPYQGKEFSDATLSANGYIKSSNATLYGKASFTTGKDAKYDWNSLRYAEEYWPYITCDSTGGDYKYETYRILGAYSFRVRKLFMGVSGEYTGDFAYRQNDPRSENVTSWLTLKYGVSVPLAGNTLAFGAKWTNHHQHLDLDFFRSGQFAGFFYEYGFGMFDYVHSPIFNNMELIMHGNEFGVNASFSTNPSCSLRQNVWLEYNRRLIKSEEETYKINLFQTTTSDYRLNYSLLYSGHRFGLGWFTNADVSSRDGQENLFERSVVSVVDNVDIYDYTKVGKQNRYTLLAADVQSSIKASCFLSRATVSLLAGARYYRRCEKYSDRNFEILNSNVTPMAGIQFESVSRLCNIDVKGTYGRVCDLDHKYTVGVNLAKHTEFQHAFTPYAYNAYEGNIYTVTATLSHQFSFATLGVRCLMLVQQAHRLGDVEYSSERYNASNPVLQRQTISLTPDKHNAAYGRITLFATF